MDDDKALSDIQKRIQDLKSETLPESVPLTDSETGDSPEDKQGLGAAYELIMTPVVCGGMGIGLDHLFSTAPACFITLAILGVCAGFWRLYRVSQNIQTPLELKRLQEKQKQGRKARISDTNSVNSD